MNTYTKTNNPIPTYGENSASVLALQKELNTKYNAGLTEDSKYGPLTQAAVSKYISNPKEAAVVQGEKQVKNDANAYSNIGSTSDGSIVSSSASKRVEEGKIKSDLANLSPTSANETTLREKSDAYIKEIDNQLSSLQTQLTASEGSINASFDETRRQTEKAQNNEKGSTTVGLARIGGYLGNSASAIGAMINLGETHKAEIANLENKRQSALQAARDAYNTKRFEFVKLKLQEAKDIEKDIIDRKDKFFEQTLSLTQARQNEDKNLRDAYKDDLEKLSFLSPEQIDPAKLQEIDNFYGTTGFAKNYIEVVKAGNEAKNEKAQLENRKNLLSLLKDIPSGKTVKFPDGTEYTGLGSAGDISTTLQVDNSGVGRIVAYNKMTGQSTITNVGAVGKTNSSANSVDPTTKDNVVAMLQMRLEESKMKDGTYDPDTYLSERKLIKEAYPALIPTIDNLFLNKTNSFFSNNGIIRLRRKGVFYGDQALSGSGVEEPVGQNAQTME